MPNDLGTSMPLVGWEENETLWVGMGQQQGKRRRQIRKGEGLVSVAFAKSKPLSGFTLSGELILMQYLSTS